MLGADTHTNVRTYECTALPFLMHRLTVQGVNLRFRNLRIFFANLKLVEITKNIGSAYYSLPSLTPFCILNLHFIFHISPLSFLPFSHNSLNVVVRCAALALHLATTRAGASGLLIWQSSSPCSGTLFSKSSAMMELLSGSKPPK